MPKIQFGDLPRAVWHHLLERVAERRISLHVELSRGAVAMLGLRPVCPVEVSSPAVCGKAIRKEQAGQRIGFSGALAGAGF